jgi:hypothetical protein
MTRLRLRTRSVAAGGTEQVGTVDREWDPARTAVVICDMWDAHHCVSAERRTVEMSPRMNEVQENN